MQGRVVHVDCERAADHVEVSQAHEGEPLRNVCPYIRGRALAGDDNREEAAIAPADRAGEGQGAAVGAHQGRGTQAQGPGTRVVAVVPYRDDVRGRPTHCQQAAKPQSCGGLHIGKAVRIGGWGEGWGMGREPHFCRTTGVSPCGSTCGVCPGKVLGCLRVGTAWAVSVWGSFGVFGDHLWCLCVGRLCAYAQGCGC